MAKRLETENRFWSDVVLTKKEWEAFRPIIRERKLIYEPSGYYDDIHVCVFVNKAEEDFLNTCLEKICT